MTLVRRDCLIDSLKMNLEGDLLLAQNRTYEMEFNLKTKYDSFFRENLELFSFDESMNLLLEEKDSIFKLMDAFCKSISLPNFIRELNEIHVSSVQAVDTKMTANESQLLQPAVPGTISALQSELVSSETFEVTGIPGKCKASPKKESAVEKRKKHQAMTHNARRRIGGMNLTRGYNIMPKDRAEYNFRNGTYTPTIKINNSDEFIAFDLEFPPETRAHGFMISFKGETQYWNKTKKNFQTEVIKLKI